MNATLNRLIGSTGARVAQALLLAATLMPGVVGPAPPALAAEPIVHDHRDPDARVLLVIRKIIVHNDLDWGDGDIRIDVRVRTNGQPCAPLYNNWDDPCGQLVVGSSFPEFDASDGDAVALNRYIPQTSDLFYDGTQVGPEIGIPIRLGNWYGLSVRGREIDTTVDDQMGTLDTTLTEGGQVRFGTFTERSIGCIHDFGEFCSPQGDGAFSVEYQIRPAILPDLRPVAINVLPLPGSNAKLFCVAIQNTGPVNAGPFNLAVHVDGVASPEGAINAGGMASGQAGDLCVEMTLAPGQHRLTAIVDGAKAVTEVSETNNRFEQPYIATRVGGSDSPVGQPPVGNVETSPVVTVVPAASPAPTGPTTRPTATTTPTSTTKPSPTPAAKPNPSKTTMPVR